MASLTFCLDDIFRPKALFVNNLCSALNSQSTGEHRTRISQLTTEILQRKHGLILRNKSTPQNFEARLLLNINGDPLLSFTLYTADSKAYLLAKATKYKMFSF